MNTMFSGNRRVFRILRFFSVTSLLCVLLAATLLALLYRHAAIDGMVDLGERSNLMLSRSLLNALEPGLSEYLIKEDVHHTEPLPKSLEIKIRDLMVGTSVVSVTILDDEGVVIFSTKAGLRGQHMGNVSGYKEALAGALHSSRSDFGGFSLFFFGMTGEKRISSFIPVRINYFAGLSGVFAVETDVSPLMMEIELTGMQVFFASMGIMALLYVALLYIVRYAEQIIRSQETSLREHSRTLEMLSSQLITEQENEKKRVAHELHEGVAQTLSSIKFRVEHAVQLLNRQQGKEKNELESLVPVVQDLIKEVRQLALEMRPPSLDELGALATLQWYCHELEVVYPRLKIQQTFLIEEQDIPMPIRLVLFRAVQQRLQFLARKNVPLAAEVIVAKEDKLVLLTVTDIHSLSQQDENEEAAERSELMTLREFLTLSGAEVRLHTPNGNGKTTIEARWPI